MRAVWCEVRVGNGCPDPGAAAEFDLVLGAVRGFRGSGFADHGRARFANVDGVYAVPATALSAGYAVQVDRLVAGDAEGNIAEVLASCRCPRAHHSKYGEESSLEVVHLGLWLGAPPVDDGEVEPACVFGVFVASGGEVGGHTCLDDAVVELDQVEVAVRTKGRSGRAPAVGWSWHSVNLATHPDSLWHTRVGGGCRRPWHHWMRVRVMSPAADLLELGSDALKLSPRGRRRSFAIL